MPLLFDDDLLFEDSNGVRSTTVINCWACELPTNGCPSPNSWPYYVRTVREWLEFTSRHGVALFDSRRRLKAALSAYSVYRAQGPIKHRFEASTWNQNMGILAGFYKWAKDEEYADSEPFTYRQAVWAFKGQVRRGRVNQSRRRQAKPHVTIKYLDDDFTDIFLKALAGLDPDGERDLQYRGRELARNSAVGRMIVSSGLRSQEYTYLLACEVPLRRCRCRSRSLRVSPREASIASRGSTTTRWLSCTPTSLSNGQLRRSHRRGVRRHVGESRCS